MDAETSTPVDIAAQAIAESHDDLSTCRYYVTAGDSSVPTEECSFGCYDEPQCVTCNPGPWPAESIRARYPDLFREERALGEPDEDNYLDAIAVLEDLHAAGWRIVRTSSCQCGQPDGVHGDADIYPAGERIVAEWTPSTGEGTGA